MEQPIKKQRLTSNQPVDIIDTVVNNEITNTDVLNSYHYFQNLKSIDPNNTQIITDYRSEHDETEDYNEDSDLNTYPKINYSVVNWLFSTISNTKNNVLSNNLYIPDILKFKFIKNKVILNNFLNQQITNAYLMNNLLNSFPKITIAPIIVYRGITDAFFNLLQNNISRGQITFSCFLSTSLFIDTAKRFTFNLKHIMSIEIPTNTSLAYISNNLEYMTQSFNGSVSVSGEAEVLIPINATLVEISEPENDGEYTIHKFRLAGYLKETRNSQRLATAFVDKFSEDIFNKIDKKEEEEEEEEETPDSQESLVENSFGGNKLFKITHNKTKKKRQRSNKNKKKRQSSNKKKSGKNKKKRTNKKRY